MKKLLLLMLAAVCMQSCGGKTGKPAADGVVAETGIDKHSEAYIRQRIDTIYKGVGKSTYDSEGKEVSYFRRWS